MRALPYAPLFLLVALFASSDAFADQCAWVTEPQANGARARLKPGIEVLYLCELCDGDRPRTDVVRTVELLHPQPGSVELVVNDEPIDLAYVFVKRSGNTWDNLARLAECETSGVSSELEYPASPSSSKKGTVQEQYAGRYTRADGRVTVTLTKQKLHGPNWVAMKIDLISDEWGDQRGELKGYLHADKKPALFVTPFMGCHFNVEKTAEDTLRLTERDAKKCGAVGELLRGTYARKKL
jgi:hypothetical protein